MLLRIKKYIVSVLLAIAFAFSLFSFPFAAVPFAAVQKTLTVSFIPPKQQGFCWCVHQRPEHKALCRHRVGFKILETANFAGSRQT